VVASPSARDRFRHADGSPLLRAITLGNRVEHPIERATTLHPRVNRVHNALVSLHNALISLHNPLVALLTCVIGALARPDHPVKRPITPLAHANASDNRAVAGRQVV
jgi:hypothetical protein